MKKKSKKKKEKSPRFPDQVANDVEYIDKRNDEEKSASRNTSRGRRSLSSLFRRSGDEKHRTRSESPEKSRSGRSVTDENFVGEVGEVQDSPELDPKVNPRKHLGRMTVREALIDNKKRGRSPGQTMVKLEKRVIDNEPRDSLSASLPHILDQFPDPEDVKLMDHETPHVSGNTLPRIKKRGRAEKRVSKNSSDNTEWTSGHKNKILPLDKRKYMINNKTKNNTSLDLPDASNTINYQSPSRSPYSGSSRDISPYSQSSFIEQENLRRESFAHFLQLRGRKPPSHSSTLSIDKGSASALSLKHEPGTSPFEVVIPSGKIPAASENVFSNVSPSRKPQISQPFPSDIGKVSHKSKRLSVSENRNDIPISEDIHHRRHRTENEQKRGSYVSPRRFSRNSRSSETSNRSQEDNIPLNTVVDMVQENNVLRYQRQFSNTSEKYKMKKRKEKELKNVQENRDNHQEEFKPTEHIFDKPEETIQREISAVADVQIKETSQQTETSMIPERKSSQVIIEQKTKIEMHDEGTQTLDEDIELYIKPNVLPVKTVESSTDVPNIKKENMFRPICDESENHVLVDDVFDTSNDLKVSHDDVEISTPISKDDAVETDTSKQETISSDINDKGEKQELTRKDTFGKKEKKDKSKSKSVKKKSEKKKKKSKGEAEEHHNKTIKTSKESDNCPAHGSDQKADEIQPDKNEQELTNKKDKGKEKQLSKKRKKSKKICKISKGKPNEPEPKPLKKTGRAASLSDITISEKLQKHVDETTKLKKPYSCKRSRSVEHIPSHSNSKHTALSEETMIKKPLTAEKKDTEEEPSIAKVPKEQKPTPKLSITAIVAIRAKIARMKKAKQLAAKKLAEEKETKSDDNLNNEKNENQEKLEVKMDDDEIPQSDDAIQDKVFYENEINASLGRQSQTEDGICVDDNILSLDREVKDIVYEKRIHFSSFDDTISEEEMIKQRQRNTRLTSRRESKVRQRQKKLISCCKQAIAFLFSHIGLCSLVIGYCIAGGFIFKALEGDNELEQRAKMENIRVNFTEQIFSLAFDRTMEKSNRDLFRIEVEAILKRYSLKIFKHTKEAGWDGNDNYRNETEEVEQWSFPSSLLYAITVMTTIGYGHVAPKTVKGRVVTIAYAVLGIPLTLLCLTNIGDVMAHGFRLLYGKVFCGWCCILFQPPRRKRIDPEKGLPADDKMLVHDDEKSEEIIQVPTSVCLLLMSAYIMLGTLAFCRWETWDFVTGTYFCFITLSTIGFGDVVPGMSSKNWNKNEKLVLCGLYLLFGLSLIAMCFNLVQEDVKAKCKRLGKRLGIIDK